MRELYRSVVGSHAWGMQRPDSDFDYWVIYQVPSREFLLGRRHDRGHESSGVWPSGMPWDRSSFEIGHHINNLMKNNINHVISVFGPSLIGSANSFTDYTPRPKQDLRRIMSENPAKNIFKSVNGMTTKNLKKYFASHKAFAWRWNDEFLSGDLKTMVNPKGENIDHTAWLVLRAKKLGQIRRMVEFGFRVLTTGKYEFEGVPMGNGDYEDEQNVRQWQADLKKALDASDLPEKPDSEPFENWLYELRMDYLV